MALTELLPIDTCMTFSVGGTDTVALRTVKEFRLNSGFEQMQLKYCYLESC
jgi:hypothetical protein